MTNRSTAFKDLFHSYKKLVQTYLPNYKSNLPPSDLDLELVRAFIALFHAEVEQYFESCSQSIINETVNKFENGIITVSALGLITFSKLDEHSSGDAIVPTLKKKLRKVNERFYKAVAAHEEVISKNNGISQGYLACLFSPLGLTNNLVDTAWVTELQSLADKRGSFAHKGRKSSEGQPGLDPKDAIKYARKIIHGVGGAATGSRINSLIDFDQWAHQLSSERNQSSSITPQYWGIKHRIGWWLIGKIGNNQLLP